MLQQRSLRALRTNLLLSTDNRKMDLRFGNWRTHKEKNTASGMMFQGQDLSPQALQALQVDLLW